MKSDTTYSVYINTTPHRSDDNIANKYWIFEDPNKPICAIKYNGDYEFKLTDYSQYELMRIPKLITVFKLHIYKFNIVDILIEFPGILGYG